jgi:hypothetical protein
MSKNEIWKKLWGKKMKSCTTREGNFLDTQIFNFFTLSSIKLFKIHLKYVLFSYLKNYSLVKSITSLVTLVILFTLVKGKPFSHPGQQCEPFSLANPVSLFHQHS